MDNFENENPGTEETVETPVIPAVPAAEEIPAAEETPAAEVIPAAEETPAADIPMEPAAEPVPAEQPQTEPRKDSPFTDSPYVMDHQPAQATPGYTIPNEKGKQDKKQGGVWKTVISAVLVLALVITACAVTAEMVNDYWERRVGYLQDDMEQQILDLEREMQDRINRVGNDGNSVSGTASADGMTPGQVYAMNESSVVLVYSEVVQYGQSGYSTGSGFILTEDGYVVTNAHVVDGGTNFLVVTSDNVQHEATLVGKDADNDLAVLKIEAENLKAVTLGSSDLLIVGDQVAAIGNPLGELTSTLTVGYVSAKERYVTTEGSNSINMMQTDCAINSGNSGGPLFNMKGEVVGITTAKYSGTSTSGASIEGIGFAIPIDDVKGLIDDIIEYGYVRAAYLGVTVTTQEEPNGVYVQSVESGWCAAEAGLQAGDIIVSIGEYETPTMTRLTRAIRTYDPGDTVEMVVRRGRQEITLTITFDEKPNSAAPDQSTEQVPMPEEGDFDEWYEYFRWFYENQDRP